MFWAIFLFHKLTSLTHSPIMYGPVQCWSTLCQSFWLFLYPDINHNFHINFLSYHLRPCVQTRNNRLLLRHFRHFTPPRQTVKEITSWVAVELAAIFESGLCSCSTETTSGKSCVYSQGSKRWSEHYIWLLLLFRFLQQKCLTKTDANKYNWKKCGMLLWSQYVTSHLTNNSFSSSSFIFFFFFFFFFFSISNFNISISFTLLQ